MQRLGSSVVFYVDVISHLVLCVYQVLTFSARSAEAMKWCESNQLTAALWTVRYKKLWMLHRSP
jgi:hypothetical protein